MWPLTALCAPCLLRKLVASQLGEEKTAAAIQVEATEEEKTAAAIQVEATKVKKENTHLFL